MGSSISSALNSYYANLLSAGSAASTLLANSIGRRGSVLAINPGVVADYYSARTGVVSNNAARVVAAPTYATSAPTTAALTSAVLSGGNFVDPSSVKLTATSTSPTQARDYRNLFALYQGVTALYGLAQRATASPQGGQAGQVKLGAAFTRGLSEVQAFLGDQPFHGLTVADGTVGASVQSTVSIAKATTTYTTGAVYAGGAEDVPPAFIGNVQFTASVASLDGTTKNVAFDLGDLGSTPRTIGNVVAYLNAQLAAAGATTHFTSIRTPGVADTVQAGGKTVTLGQNPDSYALQVTTGPGETVTLGAPTSQPAVYVAETTGASAKTLASSTSSGAAAGTSDVKQQLLKFDGSAGQTGAAATARQALAPSVSSVQAQATAADGSLYVLANLSGAAPDGQSIKGAGDAALLKYDSAGHLLYARTLGAANTATGAALTLSADGTQVAIVGSVAGPLSGATSSTGAPASPSTSSTTSRSFATVYDTTQGAELWTRTTGAAGSSTATAAAFAADGTLYVTGNTSVSSSVTDVGVQQGYLQSFKATSVAGFDGSTSEQVAASDVVTTGAQLGDRSAGVAVTTDGGVIAATVNEGALVLQRFDGAIADGVGPTATRNLGDLGGGGVAGVALAADGSVVVAGTTSSGALAPGAASNAFGGGQEAFVAKVAADLAPVAGDRVTYLDTGGGSATATALTISGGQVYVAGSVQGGVTPGSRGADATTGFATAVDPNSGVVGWSTVLTGADDQAAPSAIAVAASGSSVLDRLGLPQGTLGFTPTSDLVAATSARAGDEFLVRSGGGAARSVTISADDTLSTLAKKINGALGYAGSATVVIDASGASRLKIVANTTNTVELESGPADADALGALGLTAGLVTASASGGRSIAKPAPFALDLSASLDISTTAGAVAAQTTLKTALATIQKAYHSLGAPTAPSVSAAASGPVPRYISAQIADYQLALSRLTGG